MPDLPPLVSLGAQIISFSEFQKIRDTGILGKVVVTSGYFDPIHPGHISCFLESKKLGNTLVVLVDGDRRAVEKKGKSFQDIATRCSIVSGIRSVDYVIPLETENIDTVAEALGFMKPAIFAKGGDRCVTSVPIPSAEVDICQKNGTLIVYSVGLEKKWASSNFLQDWVDFKNRGNCPLTPSTKPLAR